MRTMSETAKMLHVNLAPGEAGRYAIVPGDPDRCELIAAHLDNPRMVTRKREFTTWEAGWRAGHRCLHRYRGALHRHLRGGAP